MPTSANGSFQVWSPWKAVRLQIVDSCGPLLFYLIHITSHPSSFSSQTQQPSSTLKSSTPTLATGSCLVWRPCIAVRLELPIVDSCGPCCFVFSISQLTFLLSSSFFLTQQPFKVLPCSTPTSATGSCQVWQPCDTVRLSCKLLIVVVLCCFIQSISHLTLLLFSSSSKTSKHLNSFFSSFSFQCIFIRTQSSATAVSIERCVVAHGHP